MWSERVVRVQGVFVSNVKHAACARVFQCLLFDVWDYVSRMAALRVQLFRACPRRLLRCADAHITRGPGCMAPVRAEDIAARLRDIPHRNNNNRRIATSLAARWLSGSWIHIMFF